MIDELFSSYYKEMWGVVGNSIQCIFHLNQEKDFYGNAEKTNGILKKDLIATQSIIINI